MSMLLRLPEEYGGAYVPDCFQGILADFNHKAAKCLPTLKEELDKFLAEATPPPMLPASPQPKDGVRAIVYDAMSIDWLVAACWLMLARQSGCSGAVAGFNRASYGTALAWAAKELGYPLDLVASRELSQQAQLIRGLREFGVQVNTDKCTELFNEPSMYAFQGWFGNPNNLFFIPQSGGEGPAPFPSLCKEVYSVVVERIGIDKLAKPLFAPHHDLLALCGRGTLFLPAGVRRVDAAVYGCLTQKLVLHNGCETVLSPIVLAALADGSLPFVEGTELDVVDQTVDPRLSTAERSMLGCRDHTAVFVKEWA